MSNGDIRNAIKGVNYKINTHWVTKRLQTLIKENWVKKFGKRAGMMYQPTEKGLKFKAPAR